MKTLRRWILDKIQEKKNSLPQHACTECGSIHDGIIRWEQGHRSGLRSVLREMKKRERADQKTMSISDDWPDCPPLDTEKKGRHEG